MANSSSQESTRTSFLTSTDFTVIPPSLKFLMGNIKILVNTSLTTDNYSIWSAQIAKLFDANGFGGFLDGSEACPPQSLSGVQDTAELNPNYSIWRLVDRNLSSALNATISAGILPYVLHLDSTAQIWQTLKKRFQSSNRSKLIQLKNELHHISMKMKTMHQYLSEIKNLVDQINATGTQLDTEDVILYTLNGLPPSYQAFKTSIRTRLDPIGIDDFYSLLCSEEVNIAAEAAKIPSPPQAFLTVQGPRGRGRRNHLRGRGRYNTPSSQNLSNPRTGQQTSTLVCKICCKIGHSAFSCWHRQNLAYVPSQPTAPNGYGKTALTS